jgi:hypothetical protein
MKTQQEIDGFKAIIVKDFEKIEDSHLIKSGFLTTNTNFTRLKKYLVIFKEFIENLYDLLNIDKLLKEVKKDFEKNKNKLIINFDSLIIDNIYYMNIPNDTRIFQVIKKDPSKLHISLKDEIWETKDLWIYCKSYSGETLYPSIKTSNNEIVLSFSVTQFEPIVVYWL